MLLFIISTLPQGKNFYWIPHLGRVGSRLEWDVHRAVAPNELLAVAVHLEHSNDNLPGNEVQIYKADQNSLPILRERLTAKKKFVLCSNAQ